MIGIVSTTCFNITSGDGNNKWNDGIDNKYTPTTLLEKK